MYYFLAAMMDSLYYIRVMVYTLGVITYRLIYCTQLRRAPNY